MGKGKGETGNGVAIGRRAFLRGAAATLAACAADPARPAPPFADVGWVKSPRNPLLSLGPPGAFDAQNIMSPCAVKVDGRYYLYYAGGPAGPRTGEGLVRYQLGLAVSEDGEAWRKTGDPLLPLGARDDFHVTPALLRTPEGELDRADGLWHLVYCGNRADDIEHATSRDGLRWEKDPRSPVYRAAYAPNPVRVPGGVRIYHVHKPEAEAGAKKPWEIHLAEGSDIASLRPHPANPVLTVSQPWERGALFYPYVLREGDTWILFYAAYWTGGGRPENMTAIGLATSADGIRWEKSAANPVLTPTPDSAYDCVYTSSQSVIRDGDHWKMYYASRIDAVHKYYAIGLATKRGSLAGAGR